MAGAQTRISHVVEQDSTIFEHRDDTLTDKVQTRPRIFFGWWTVLVTGIISGIGHGFYQYGFSVFFKDLAAELGLSRALTSIGRGIGGLEGGLQSAPAGWLADRFGPKWVMFIGVAATGGALIAMNFINSAWSYFLVWGFLIGSGLNLGLTVTVDKTVINWFMRKRGLAQGIKFALIGVGGVVAVPIVTWLVVTLGWRMTCFIWGLVMVACSPLILVFVKSKGPEHYGLLPDGAQVAPGLTADVNSMIATGADYAASFEETEYTFKQAWRTSTFWLLVAAFVIQQAVIGGIGIHIIPFLTDIGISTTAASAMMGMLVFFTIPSRFFGGFLVDHISKRHLPFVLAATMLLQAIGIGTFLVYKTTPSIYVFLIFYGLSSGASMPILTVTLGRYFGRKSFGSIFGVLRAFQAPFSFIAPTYAGWVYDTTGSYITAFTSFAFLSIVSTVLLCLVRPPKALAEVSGASGLK
jgi:MFS family permease